MLRCELIGQARKLKGSQPRLVLGYASFPFTLILTEPVLIHIFFLLLAFCLILDLHLLLSTACMSFASALHHGMEKGQAAKIHFAHLLAPLPGWLFCLFLFEWWMGLIKASSC